MAAIRAIKVHRNQLGSVPDEWKVGCGFYVLVSDIKEDKFHAYVGKATQDNLHARVASHRREKENWTHAFLFQRDTSNGLTSTQASYIEGVMHRILSDCPWISVINNQIAGDKTLSDHEVFYVKQVVKSALRILNIFGYAIEEDPSDITRKENGVKKYYGVSIAALLKSGLLHEGEDLISIIDKYPAKATLGKKGIVFDEKEYSPSGATGEVFNQLYPDVNKGGRNGWSFWGANRGSRWVSLDDFRGHYLSQKALYENSLLTEKDIDFDNAVKANETNRQEYLNERDIPMDTVHEEYDELANEVIFNDAKAEQEEKDPSRHAHSSVKIYELIDSGLIEEGMKLVSNHPDFPAEAEIAFGGIAFNGNVYPSPTIAGKYARRVYDSTATEDNGWEFWGIQSPSGNDVTLSQVLDDFLEI